jgi:hypothetical protein
MAVNWSKLGYHRDYKKVFYFNDFLILLNRLGPNFFLGKEIGDYLVRVVGKNTSVQSQMTDLTRPTRLHFQESIILADIFEQALYSMVLVYILWQDNHKWRFFSWNDNKNVEKASRFWRSVFNEILTGLGFTEKFKAKLLNSIHFEEMAREIAFWGNPEEYSAVLQKSSDKGILKKFPSSLLLGQKGEVTRAQLPDDLFVQDSSGRQGFRNEIPGEFSLGHNSGLLPLTNFAHTARLIWGHYILKDATDHQGSFSLVLK